VHLDRLARPRVIEAEEAHVGVQYSWVGRLTCPRFAPAPVVREALLGSEEPVAVHALYYGLRRDVGVDSLKSNEALVRGLLLVVGARDETQHVPQEPQLRVGEEGVVLAHPSQVDDVPARARVLQLPVKADVQLLAESGVSNGDYGVGGVLDDDAALLVLGGHGGCALERRHKAAFRRAVVATFFCGKRRRTV